MPKTIEDGQRILQDWFDAGCVGNLLFFRGPQRSSIEAIVEETRKLRDVGPGTQELINELFAKLGSSKIEIRSAKDGTADNFKSTRRIP